MFRLVHVWQVFLHTRLRQNCSILKGDLFRCNLIDSCYCSCDNYVENNEHYFLHCKLFVNQRNVMLNNIRVFGLDLFINNILYGNSDFAYDVNCSLFTYTHQTLTDVSNVYVLLTHMTVRLNINHNISCNTMSFFSNNYE